MGGNSNVQKRHRRKILNLSRELDQKCGVIKVLEARLKASEDAITALEEKDKPEPEMIFTEGVQQEGT